MLSIGASNGILHCPTETRAQRQLTIKPDNKNFLIIKLYEDIY